MGMKDVISQEVLQKIEAVLGVPGKEYGNHVRFEITGEDATHHLAVELYPNTQIGARTGVLVTVYTPNSNLQLQHCSGVVVSEFTNEVTFVAESGGALSGLIIESSGGCSMYANVDRALLSGDFTQLGPEVMLSGIALSLTEEVLSRDASDSAA